MKGLCKHGRHVPTEIYDAGGVCTECPSGTAEEECSSEDVTTTDGPTVANDVGGSVNTWTTLRLLERESECRALRRRNAELEERERVRRSFKGRLWQSLRRALFGTDVPKKDERS